MTVLDFPMRSQDLFRRGRNGDLILIVEQVTKNAIDQWQHTQGLTKEG